MAKAGKAKPKSKLSKKAQHERFLETARKLGVDDEQSKRAFEQAFEKIVPPRTKQRA